MSAPTRTELFAGVEAPPEHLIIDAERLSAYAAPRIPGWRGPVIIKKFRGGQSNPTYRVETPDKTYVLRKKPGGVLLPSAHAIDREYRAIGAVHAQNFPAPAPVLFCEDETVLGTEFYMAAFVAGAVFWDVEMPGAEPAMRTAVYHHVIGALARLHSFDIARLGLGSFGRPGDYVGRQIARWSQQYRASQSEDNADMDVLEAALAAARPPQLRSALIHGDYGLHNIIIDPETGAIRAVLDWEISTLGDPLADLAHHLMPYYLPPDPARASVSTLVGRDIAGLGIPNVEQYIELYCQAAGLEQFPDQKYYIAFALYRYACMIQGIIKRAQSGNAANKNMPHTQARVALLAATARRQLDQ
jgi:aminoglycoside phosphotransferase (APT) family kinase protein